MKIAIVSAAAALVSAAPLCAAVDDLAWMAGEWTADADGKWTEERWSTPCGGIMLGTSRSVKDGAVREFEFVRVEDGKDGAPAYIAQPGGGAPVAFRLVKSEAASATFENPGHDYPQRIVYARNGDALTATISAIDGSNAMSWTLSRR